MRLFLLFFALTFGLMVKAQSITKVWEYSPPPESGEALIDWSRTRDNKIAIVSQSGEISQFRLLDVDRNKASVRQTTKFDFGEQALGIAAIDDDGSYFVVGKQNKDAWFVRLDEKGNRDAKSEYVDKGSRFEKAIWLPAGEGILAGRRGKKSALYKVRLNQYKPILLHSGTAKTKQVRLFPKLYTEAEFWLVEQSAKGIKAYCHQSEGSILSTVKLAKSDVKLFDAVPVADEGVMATGSKSESFPWYGNGAEVQDKDFSMDFGESVRAAAPVGALGAWLIVVGGRRNNRNIYRLVRYNDDFKAMDTTRLDLIYPPGDLSDLRLIPMDTDFFVLAGTLEQDNSKKSLWLCGIVLSDGGKGQRKTGIASGAKGVTANMDNNVKLVISDPVLETNTGGKDGFVHVNDQITLRYKVMNTGNAPMPVDANIEAAFLKGPVKGLYLQRYATTVTALPPGKSVIRTATLTTNADLEPGQSVLRLTIKLQGTVLATYDVLINSKGVPPTRGIDISMLEVNGTIMTIKGVLLQEKNADPNALQMTANGGLVPRGKDKNDFAFVSNSKRLGLSEFTWKVDLAPGTNVFIAKYGDDLTDTLKYVYDGKPNLHVICIGLNYDDMPLGTPYGKLKWPVNDARTFARLMADQQGNGLVGQVFIDTFCTKSNTTAAELNRAFARLKNNQYANGTKKPVDIRSFDYVVVFISGHGDTLYSNLTRKHHFYIPTSDYENGSTEGFLDYTRVAAEYLSKIKCHKMIFLDACHSGGAGGKGLVDNTVLNNAMKAAIESVPQHILFTSSSAGEISYEMDRPELETRFGKHGIFTYALIQAIKGNTVLLNDKTEVTADSNKDKALTPEELGSFLEKYVPELSNQTGKLKQHPFISYSTDAKPNFPLFILKK
jgi:Caspase domain